RAAYYWPTCISVLSPFFFSNDTAPLVTYTLSLHDALPICTISIATSASILTIAGIILGVISTNGVLSQLGILIGRGAVISFLLRSEEHTSELQSRFDLVCRLLLEKKKKNI